MGKKIRVGMDISQTAHQGGVGVYTSSLAKELENIDDLDLTFFYSSLRKPYKGNLKNVKVFKLPPTIFEIFFNKVRNVSIEKFLGTLDVFHSSDWVQPPSKAKKVTTYHDVIPLKYPNWSDPKIVAVHKRRLSIVEKECDLVIAVSETTKKDLIDISNISEDKIKVVYEGVEEIFKPQDEKKVLEFKKRFNLPESFLLAVGGVGERKNLERIKEASKDYKLIILGQDIQLSREELPILYAGADALVYVSLYEGFGLPILEAMSCGTPVLTSNISSMPEVAGDAAFKVDPEDEKEIKQGIEEVLKERDSYIKKGLKRAKEFSWKKCAQETAEIYREVMKS